MFFERSTSFKNHFIIAAPRSGTTWMSKLLNAHPEINCVERRLFGDYADFVKDDHQADPRLRVTLDKYINSLLLHHGIPKAHKDKLTKSVLKGILEAEQFASNKKITVDKITPYLNTSSLVIEAINKYFPKSKIIYLVRDGRDVLTSGVFHWFNKKPLNTELTDFELQRREVFLNSEKFSSERFFQNKEIEQWANEWKQPLGTIEKAKQSHKVKIISYENMLSKPKLVLEECLSFLGAKRNERIINRCLDTGSFLKMTKGRNNGNEKPDAHVRKGIAGDWKNYFTYTDGKLFHVIAGESLIKYGYVKDEKWFEALR